MPRSRYQYGTSPRKIEPDYDYTRSTSPRKQEPDYKRRTRRKTQSSKQQLHIVDEKQRQQVMISKEQKRNQLKTIASVLLIFGVLLAISFRNSQIDKQFSQIQNQKKQLAAIQKENEQLKVSIENSMNLSNIEKVAKEELGMQKLSTSQTVYINLPKKDYVEAASEKVVIEEKTSLWDKIVDKILNLKK